MNDENQKPVDTAQRLVGHPIQPKTKAMKRYSIDKFINYRLSEEPFADAEMVQECDGEWVAYADARAEIDRLRHGIIEASRIILDAKRRWAPHTTNSDADAWLSRFCQPNAKDDRAEGSGLANCWAVSSTTLHEREQHGQGTT